jgi:hypothetical protein
MKNFLMARTKRFNLVLPPWLKDAVRKEANEKGVSIAEVIKDAIKEHLRRREEKK